MSDSPNLALPFIAPAQAQKHVTHNEALEILDVLVQLSVETLVAPAPPASPAEGQVFGIGDGATGAFEGRAGQLAARTNGAWMYLTPKEGLRAWNLADNALYVRRGGAWSTMQAADLNALPGLGIGGDFDTTNRLSVTAPATLLTHAGAGHQLKINKAAAADTASLLYQTGFSGRAEMGLAGNDDFAIKVSADGAAWTTALSVDAASGQTGFGGITAASVTGPAVQQNVRDTTPGRLMRADWGYGRANAVGPVSQFAGVPTGALVERGENANGSFVRFADGTQICTIRTLQFSVVGSIVAVTNWSFPAAFATPPDFLSVTLSLDATHWSNAGARSSISGVGPQGSQSGSVGRIMLYLSKAETANITNAQGLAVGRWF